MWAVLTRLSEPKKAGLSLMQKLKLYNGKNVPGYTEDSVRELMEEQHREGMNGISPRYIQDKTLQRHGLPPGPGGQNRQPLHGPQRN